MLRTLGLLAVALAGAASAHSSSQRHVVCSNLLPDGGVDPACADPAWVAKFSQAADGPEQIWLNFGRTLDAMVVGWLTSDMTAATVVQWGTTSGGPYPNQASGNSTFYKYSSKYTSGLIHHATMTGLAPASTYYYRVGDGASSWSSEYAFKSNSPPGTFPYTFGTVADVGEGADPQNTINHLITRLPNIDALSINGDIAYASGCEANGCTNWDAFQRMMQPVAATRSFTINLGNHETYDTANGIIAISARTRFNGMPYPPGSTDDCWYFSYNAGPVHVLSISSFYPGGYSASSKLVQFATADLAAVNRTQYPWVLVILHAPLYNSNTEHQGDGEPVRQALESVFLQNKVNAVLGGHVHAYERSTPVSTNGQVVPDGQGIVHFNIGDGGAALYTSWMSPQPAWSAFRQATWGHGEIHFINATTAEWTWHRNQDNEPVIDDSYTIHNVLFSA